MGADPHWESHRTAPQERTSKHHQRSGAFEVPKSHRTLENRRPGMYRCRYPTGPNDLSDISNNAKVWGLRSMHLDRLQSLWPASPQALPVQHASIRSEGNRLARRWPWTVNRLRCQLNTTRATGCRVTWGCERTAPFHKRRTRLSAHLNGKWQRTHQLMCIRFLDMSRSNFTMSTNIICGWSHNVSIAHSASSARPHHLQAIVHHPT